jgi:hypothetical protein
LKVVTTDKKWLLKLLPEMFINLYRIILLNFTFFKTSLEGRWILIKVIKLTLEIIFQGLQNELVRHSIYSQSIWSILMWIIKSSYQIVNWLFVKF